MFAKINFEFIYLSVFSHSGEEFSSFFGGLALNLFASFS